MLRAICFALPCSLFLLALPSAAKEPPAVGDVVLPLYKVQTDKAQKAAKLVYDSRCVVCHGPTGDGDGPVAMAIQPRPRAFTDAAWQQGVKDAVLVKSILEGGAAIGKSPAMPAHADIDPKIATALVALIRAHKEARVVVTFTRSKESFTRTTTAKVGAVPSIQSVPYAEYEVTGFVDGNGDGKPQDGERTFTGAVNVNATSVQAKLK